MGILDKFARLEDGYLAKFEWLADAMQKSCLGMLCRQRPVSQTYARFPTVPSVQASVQASLHPAESGPTYRSIGLQDPDTPALVPLRQTAFTPSVMHWGGTFVE